MPLVDMKDLLDHARGNGYAVAAFGLGSLELLEAIMSTSERSRSPVILSLTESHFERYDFELAMAATERAARRADVPVAIHLDHGASFSSAVRAISLGCNGVMVDASRENFPTNVALTHRVVEMAHACGVTVEGELGYVAGEGGDARPGDVVYTPVEEARVYAERTQVDCLAVSVGALQGALRGRPRLDYERLKRIHEAVDIPLVIHGASGLSDEQIRRLVAYGVAKINHYTALSDVAARAIRANAKAGGGGYLDLHLGVREAVSAEVERCQRVCGATGRAAEVLARCRPWRPAKRVLLYNVEGGQDAEVEAIMARGREALSKIPGVRRVVTGWAVTQTPRYRYCWLVEFAHEKAAANYRDHPDQLAFASCLPRPIAPERISIDFAQVG